jgi:hypothetical protein
MTEKPTSQTQQNVFNANPFVLPGFEAWQQLVESHLGRLETLNQTFEAIEVRTSEQARAAIDEGSRLMRESLAQATKLSAEWRKLAMDAARSGMSVVGK